MREGDREGPSAFEPSRRFQNNGYRSGLLAFSRFNHSFDRVDSTCLVDLQLHSPEIWFTRIGGQGMNYLLVLVGGTGQIVGHYWAQMSMLGLALRNVAVRVVDTDDRINSLGFLGEKFHPLFADAIGLEAANRLLPTVSYIPVRADLDGNDIMHVLASRAVPAGGFEHEAQAFFSLDSLRQQASQGLYARPALSAVTALKEALAAVRQEDVQDDTRIVVVSSCIGGTGGGLTIPLLYRLQELAHTRTNVDVRLVLLGQYFVPTQGFVGDAYQRFESNRELFIQTLRESIPDLHSYVFVEDDVMPDRDTRGERIGRHLPWPEANQPYWKAVCAVDDQMRDTARDRQARFEDRRVEERLFAHAINRDDAVARLKRALGRIEAMTRHAFPQALENEPLPARIWGRPVLGNLRTLYHRIWLARAKGSLDGLGAQVHDSMRFLWSPRGDEFGFGTIFPESRPIKAAPSAVERVDWPLVKGDIPAQNLANPEYAARVVAAYLLFGALGFGD